MESAEKTALTFPLVVLRHGVDLQHGGVILDEDVIVQLDDVVSSLQNTQPVLERTRSDREVKLRGQEVTEEQT